MKSLLILFAAVVTVAARGIEHRKFYVNSEIVSRYSITTVTSVVFNNDSVSRELSFHVQLPETAFISNFTMNVNGMTYHGVAKEKEEAASQYEVLQQQGENVGLVESRATNLFAVRINAAANSTATFQLIYEELIIRRKSKYQQVINLNPGSVVEDLQVTVRVIDQQGIGYTGASEYVSIQKPSEQEAFFSYSPLPGDQGDTVYGLARDLVVEYDVKHPSTGAGLFVVNDCHFAQFFSPVGLPALPVDIVFVIDVSGSMSGRKIEQTREALQTIIYQLRRQDRFTMVTFESSVTSWRNYLVPARVYKYMAAAFARNLTAGGYTNFNDAVLRGASILEEGGISGHIQLLVVMTDGVPTAGVLDPSVIISNVRRALTGTSISLNCLGFGEDVNFDLLEQLALFNKGIAQRIYEGNDATSQMEGFFKEITTPILSELQVKFPDGSTENVSTTAFPLLFNGSEIVVAGKFRCEPNNSDTVSVRIIGQGLNHEITYETQVHSRADTTITGRTPSTERLMAHLFIRQLSDKLKVTDSKLETARSQLMQRIIELALKYNFATNFTSLLVVEGEDRNTVPPGGDPTRMTPTLSTAMHSPTHTGLLDDASSTNSQRYTEIQFINDSPRVVENNGIEMWFRVVGPYSGYDVTCRLKGHNYHTHDHSASCEHEVFKYVHYTGLERDKYTFRVMATAPNRDRVARSVTLHVGYGPHYCYVHWINQGVTVHGRTAKAEFVGVGNFSSLQCKIDQGPYQTCTSPHHLTGLSTGNHTFRIKAEGPSCTVNDKTRHRITHKFQI